MANSMKGRVCQCTVCGGDITYPVVPHTKRFSCISIGDKLQSDLPSECWQNNNNILAKELLQAIPAHFIYSVDSCTHHQQRIELSLEILEAMKDKTPPKEFWFELLEKYGKRLYKKFYFNLPESSSLRDLMQDSVDSFVKRKGIKVIADPIELPADFQRALDAYHDAGMRRFKLKIERGNKCQLETISKRTKEAKFFCEFLALRGYQFWPQVGQHDFDEFIDAYTRKRGANVYTFLKFLKFKFKLTQKFIRPKNKNRAPTESVATTKEMRQAIVKLVQCKDTQLVIAGLFLLLFAQTVSRTSELKENNFKRVNGKLFAIFYDEWTPIDPLTEKYLCQYLPDMARSDFEGSDKPLFTYNKSKLTDYVSLVVDKKMKQLRLGAVANLIRAGVTDRTSIHHILGVSLPTLVLVEKTFQWDLQSTVAPEIIASRNEVIRGERTE